jgi:hypothetical protein
MKRAHPAQDDVIGASERRGRHDGQSDYEKSAHDASLENAYWTCTIDVGGGNLYADLSRHAEASVVVGSALAPVAHAAKPRWAGFALLSDIVV